MELLDVVNDLDEVIDVQPRATIHKLGLMHRASHILVFNSAGELFLQKRSESKDNDPGLWDSSCAGHVDTGESYLDCAVRELEEELALRVSPGQLKQQFKLPPQPSTGNEFAMIYTAISDDTLSLDPDEIDDGTWLAMPELEQWIAEQPEALTLAFRIIWDRVSR